MGRFRQPARSEIRVSHAEAHEAPFQSARPLFRTPSIDQPDMPMIMMIRADRPSNSPAKTAPAIFEGDTGTGCITCSRKVFKRPRPASGFRAGEIAPTHKSPSASGHPSRSAQSEGSRGLRGSRT